MHGRNAFERQASHTLRVVRRERAGQRLQRRHGLGAHRIGQLDRRRVPLPRTCRKARQLDAHDDRRPTLGDVSPNELATKPDGLGDVNPTGVRLPNSVNFQMDMRALYINAYPHAARIVTSSYGG
jgi:hypothetical protein